MMTISDPRRDTAAPGPRPSPATLPGAETAETVLPEITLRIGERTPVFFLDFDGTIAPLVARPELATLPRRTRELLRSLAERHLVCVLSGRGLSDLQQKVGLDGLYYGADHGRRIVGPPGSGVEHEVGGDARATMKNAAIELERALAHIPGVVVEAKDLSLSAHYRLTMPERRREVTAIVRGMAERLPRLSLSSGKLVHELRPDDGWDKGHALLWLLHQVGLTFAQVCPVCLGDDLTDEDMFRVVRNQGVAVLVGCRDAASHAHFRLSGVDEAMRLLEAFDTRSRQGAAGEV